MYSLVSICKKCNRRVLDAQLKISSSNNCIHCYIEELKLKFDQEYAIHLITKQERQDLLFAFQLLDRNYQDLLVLTLRCDCTN